MEENFNKRGYEAGSLQKAISIVEAFNLHKPSLNLSEICKETGLNKSTTFRLLRTLQQNGWINKDEASGRYTIGIKMFKLGSVALEQKHLGESINKRLLDLTQELQETAHVSVINDDQLLYVNKVESSQSIRMVSTIGDNSPLHCTAMGKVLLAFMPEERARAIIDKVGVKRYTPNTKVGMEEIFGELRLVRARGYAIHDGEYENGVCCVGAPIRNFSEEVIAAISVSGPSYRMKAKGLEMYIEPVMRTAKLISQDLGYKGND